MSLNSYSLYVKELIFKSRKFSLEPVFINTKPYHIYINNQSILLVNGMKNPSHNNNQTLNRSLKILVRYVWD